MMEDVALWLIVAQGFFIMYFEYDVWRMNKHRFVQRELWRIQKQVAAIKKREKIEPPG